VPVCDQCPSPQSCFACGGYYGWPVGLTSLSLHTASSLDILRTLPRGIKTLTIGNCTHSAKIDWTAFPPFLQRADLSYTGITASQIAKLPRTLQELDLSRSKLFEQVIMPDMTSSLPPSLTKLIGLKNCFMVNDALLGLPSMLTDTDVMCYEHGLMASDRLSFRSVSLKKGTDVIPDLLSKYPRLELVNFLGDKLGFIPSIPDTVTFLSVDAPAPSRSHLAFWPSLMLKITALQQLYDYLLCRTVWNSPKVLRVPHFNRFPILFPIRSAFCACCRPHIVRLIHEIYRISADRPILQASPSRINSSSFGANLVRRPAMVRSPSFYTPRSQATDSRTTLHFPSHSFGQERPSSSRTETRISEWRRKPRPTFQITPTPSLHHLHPIH
jgi:hypothetical protein